MSKILKNKIFLKLLTSALLFPCIEVFSEPSLNNIQITPIITTKEEIKKGEEKKNPPAPGLSFGIPSAYGASEQTIFIGASYGASVKDGIFTFYNSENAKVADGSMNFGLGIGDPNQLAAEVSIGIISLACQNGESCFGADGTAGAKLHKRVESPFLSGWGIGYSDIIRWGEASDFATIYGVASKDFKIQDKDALLSLGIGTGGFRTKADIDSNKNNPNLFGGIGVNLAPRLSLASSWNGSTLASGFGISPFNFPLSVSLGVTDITDVNGKGAQYSVNMGYSFSF